MPLLNEWYTQTSYAVMHHPAMTGVCMCNKFYNALLDICKIAEQGGKTVVNEIRRQRMY